MTTLVTGATGLLGRHLLPLLAERGDRLRALLRERSDDAQCLALDAEVVRGDVLDPEALRRAAAGCERVFHLAGLVAHERSDETRLHTINVEAVRRLLDALEPGTRLLHVSSVAAVGPALAPDRPVDESHDFPAWAADLPYARTKRAGERLALAARHLEVIVANPAFLLGPGDVHGISTWPVRRYLQGVLRFHTPGGLSFVDARDVARGLVLLEERGRPGERTILADRRANLSHAQFFRRVGEVTGVRRLMVGLPRAVAIGAATLVPWPARPGEVRGAANWWFYDPAKAERELGFRARPLEETIADTAADR